MLKELSSGNDSAACELYGELWRKLHFDAVIIPSYLYARPLLKVLKTEGVSVPDDVAAICTDDWIELEQSPSISHYARHPYEYGVEAVQGLDQTEFFGREKIMRLDFIAGESTHAPRNKNNAAVSKYPAFSKNRHECVFDLSL